MCQSFAAGLHFAPAISHLTGKSRCSAPTKGCSAHKRARRTETAAEQPDKAARRQVLEQPERAAPPEVAPNAQQTLGLAPRGNSLRGAFWFFMEGEGTILHCFAQKVAQNVWMWGKVETKWG